MKDKNSDPLDSIIEFAWATGADRFWVNNAKDELKKLREEINNLKNRFDNPVAFAKINERGDLFDLRLQANPYTTNLYPLYLRPDYAEQRQQIMQSSGEK